MLRILEIWRWKFPRENLETLQKWKRGVLYSFGAEYKIVFMWLLKKIFLWIQWMEPRRMLSQELRNCSQIFPVRINIWHGCVIGSATMGSFICTHILCAFHFLLQTALCCTSSLTGCVCVSSAEECGYLTGVKCRGTRQRLRQAHDEQLLFKLIFCSWCSSM